MAQNITLLGASYTDVPAVLLPKTGGGTALFADPSVTDAVASDVASGKKFLLADGSIGTGTASGGGGSSWELIKSTTLENVSTTSTSNATAGTISLGSGAFTKDDIILVHVRDTAGKRAGYFYGSDAIFVNANKANGSTSTFTAPGVTTIRYSTSSQFAAYTGAYGVWGYSITSDGTLTVRKRYNSNYSLTVNGNYLVQVYKLTPPSGMVLFG